jgi:N-acetylmuramoyl-L-alanine amidase
LIKERGAYEENFQVLRRSKMPATLLEIGFLSNPEELRALQNEEYKDTLSTAIAEGIATWLNSRTS